MDGWFAGRVGHGEATAVLLGASTGAATGAASWLGFSCWFGVRLVSGWGLAVLLSGLFSDFLLGQATSPMVGGEGRVFDLWPGAMAERMPGDPADFSLPPEGDTSGPNSPQVAGRAVVRLGNVSRPQVEVFHPLESGVGRGAVVICPGGGYHILAYDLEGTEVAAWLNSIGLTAVVLKYRVPARAGAERWRAAVIDAQRAVSWTRQQAGGWGVDPQKIGILGFSAGGHAAALVSSGMGRQYPGVDQIDQVSCQPDYSMLIYPGYLVEGGELSQPLASEGPFPPTFLVHTHDDPVTPLSSLTFASHLHKLGVPVELHLYRAGGHGYGLRETESPVTRWPQAATEWLRGVAVLADSP